MILNKFGRIVKDEWFKTAKIRGNVQLHEDEFVVMPNHLHGIVWIVAGATGPVAPTQNDLPHGPKPGSVGAIIGQFKSVTTKRFNQILHSPGASLWQRNYYEHIVRNDGELYAIRKYIRENPRKWELDQDNPVNLQIGNES